MTKVANEIIRYSDRSGKQRLQFFEKNKSFFGGKREKETSLKENKGKDFFSKKWGRGQIVFIKKAKKFFRNRFLTQT